MRKISIETPFPYHSFAFKTKNEHKLYGLKNQKKRIIFSNYFSDNEYKSNNIRNSIMIIMNKLKYQLIEKNDIQKFWEYFAKSKKEKLTKPENIDEFSNIHFIGKTAFEIFKEIILNVNETNEIYEKVFKKNKINRFLDLDKDFIKNKSIHHILQVSIDDSLKKKNRSARLFIYISIEYENNELIKLIPLLVDLNHAISPRYGYNDEKIWIEQLKFSLIERNEWQISRRKNKWIYRRV